ncbi:MAG: TonB-dependent receptor plug domain-containing protein, partial [Bacteroidales bacterium]|nr:TonB-dependent receptor plug domain-containing protein [Bacteroidales bacterium]
MVQQDATWILHGTVVDSENVPVIGAGVINLNTKTGDITNNDGKFGVSVKVGDRLEVSCIGYSTKEIVVTSQDNIVVILENDSELLEEVVVMGYGTQKKKLVTGSTVNVTSDKIAAVNPVDALGSLQSQAAGLSITQNSGQPGESYKVFIRGLGTLGASEPIYVIDGVPGGDITAIAPNDIESIDVLKAAASSASSGARAANGVILVTTK